MKSIKKVIITIISAAALTGMASVMADNSTSISSDGFLELTVQEAPAAVQARQSANTQSAKQLRAERKKRAQRRAAAERKKKSAAAKRAAAKRAKSKTYRVRRGDTLMKISRKTGVSLSRLVRLNRLYGSKKNHIEVGQRIRLR